MDSFLKDKEKKRVFDRLRISLPIFKVRNYII